MQTRERAGDPIRDGRSSVMRIAATMAEDEISLEEWNKHVFEHPVTEPPWYEAEREVPWCPNPAPEPSAARTVSLLAETFERSGELLASFTDDQLGQGFWYLVSYSDYTCALWNQDVPLADRIRA